MPPACLIGGWESSDFYDRLGMDRTTEFASCVQLHKRTAPGPRSISPKARDRPVASTFAAQASRISKQLGETTRKLERLAQRKFELNA